MAKISRFEDLKIWQAARTLVRVIYQLGTDPVIKRDYGFRDQLQRAALSVMSNIAEGFERGTNADFVRFLNMAKGSSGEVRSLLQVAEDIGYISPASAIAYRADYAALSRQISALATYLNNRQKTTSKAENRR